MVSISDVNKEVNDIKLILDIIVGKFNALVANTAIMSSVSSQLNVNSNAVLSSSDLYSRKVVCDQNERRRGQKTSISRSGSATPARGGSCSIPSFVPHAESQTAQLFSSAASLGQANGTTTITASFPMQTAAAAAGANTQAGVLFSSDTSQSVAPIATSVKGSSVQFSGVTRQQTPGLTRQQTPRTARSIERTGPRQPLGQNITVVSGSVVSGQSPSALCTTPSDQTLLGPLLPISRGASMEAPVGNASTSAIGTRLSSSRTRGSTSYLPPAQTALPTPSDQTLIGPLLPISRGASMEAPVGNASTSAIGTRLSPSRTRGSTSYLPPAQTALPSSLPAAPSVIPSMSSLPSSGLAVTMSSTSVTPGTSNLNAPLPLQTQVITTNPEFSAVPQPGMGKPTELIATAMQPSTTQAMSPLVGPSAGGFSGSKLQPGTLTDILFDAVDKNRNGVIDRTEFRSAVQNDVIRPVGQISTPSGSSGTGGDKCSCLRDFVS